MKRLLLTGASGFIGRAVLERLDPDQWEVVACSRQPAPEALPACVAAWRSVDLLDPRQARAAISEAKASHWLHLAWHTTHGTFWKARQNLDWTIASLLMLEHFRMVGGKHAVMAGTCAEYDWRHGFCREDETPLNPQSLYGTAKDSLRRLAEAYCAGQDIRFAWGRVFSPFGPREGRQRFIPSVIRAMLAGESVRCSHGRQYRDFLSVPDLADGFGTLLETDAGGSFNIASSTPRQPREIVRLLSAITGWSGTPEFGSIPVADDDPPFLIGDNRKLRALGWEASTELAKGLEDTVNWWRDRENPDS